MRLLLLLRSVALGLFVGYAGWHGATWITREGRPQRLLERAVAVAPAEPITGLTAVFLFRPDECPDVMGVTEMLQGLGPDKVRIVGALMVEEHRMPEWRLLVEAQRIRFPVYRLDPGNARASTGSLGYAGQSLLLLFDRDGRVVLATDALKQPGLKAILESLAGRLTVTHDHRRARA